MRTDKSGSHPVLSEPVGRRKILAAAGMAAGAGLVAAPRRSRAADRDRDHLRERQVLRQGDDRRGRRRLQPGAEQGPRHLYRAAAAELVDRGASGAGAAARPAQPARRTCSRRTWSGSPNSLAPAGRCRSTSMSRPTSARSYFPGLIAACTYQEQADGAALVRRFRHALLPARTCLRRPAPRCPRPGTSSSRRRRRSRRAARRSSAICGRASRPRCWSATLSR